MAEAPERNLAMDIVRITEAAALASARWVGRGNKEAGDGAAVEAMRNSFSTIHIDGVVVIGEGEKDKAPMLYSGEKVGIGDGPKLDVAVDPVEGTNLLAYGRPNAISVVGIAPRGSMFNLAQSFYMQKLVVGARAKGVVDLDAPVHVNLERVAKALGKNVRDLMVFVLDKPRHQRLIEEIREAGCGVATDKKTLSKQAAPRLFDLTSLQREANNKFGFSAKKLAGYNEIPRDYPLEAGDIVYLEKKKKKAEKGYDYAVVRSGDSMHSIAQRYGIRLKNLYKMNKLPDDYIPSVGDTLKLR